MKTKWILLLAFALVFVFAGCEDDDSGGDQNTAATVTVKFDLNGGTGATPAAKTVSQGTGITLPSSSGFSKTGFTFGGWNANAEGTGTNYAASASFTPNGDITLYAKWDAVGETYTVTFRLNGGSGSAPDQTVSAGGSINLPSGDGISRNGFTFTGWNTNANGSGTGYQPGELFTPAGNIILYAQWVYGYAVTFYANTAKGTPPAPMISVSSIILPGKGGLTRAYSTFTGWNTSDDGSGTNYSAGAPFTPTRSITLYAQWVWDGTTYESLTGIDNQLAWLQLHAESNISYAIDVTSDVSIEPTPIGGGINSTTVTITGSGGNKIDLASNGSMFTIKSGVTLVLKNITLRGRDNNNASLVKVDGGALTMETGSAISNNAAPAGGGVYMNYGSFTMNGGTISGNTASAHGGGVFVHSGISGTFTMNGGTISGNTSQGDGGGVCVSMGTFTMSSGTISGNSSQYGGGVLVGSSVGESNNNLTVFTMTGGIISGNTASSLPDTLSRGGGVFVGGTLIWGNPHFSTFVKTGGTIYGYSAGDTNSNVVKDSYYGTIRSNCGHAVFFQNLSFSYESNAGNFTYRDGQLQ